MQVHQYASPNSTPYQTFISLPLYYPFDLHTEPQCGYISNHPRRNKKRYITILVGYIAVHETGDTFSALSMQTCPLRVRSTTSGCYSDRLIGSPVTGAP